MLEEFVAEGEGLPTRRFIDTADPEETARLIKTATPAAKQSAEPASTQTSDPASSSSSSSEETKSNKAEKPKEGQ